MEQRSPEEGGRGLLPVMPRNSIILPHKKRDEADTAAVVESTENYSTQPGVGLRTNEPTARDFAPPIAVPESIGAPESTEALNRKFNGYKLETNFYDSYVVHKTYEWKELSSRSWEISKWVKKGRIGSGAFGTVWLQEKEGKGQLRAVKQLPRDSSREEGYSQELLALVKLKGYNHLFVDFIGWYENLDYTFLAMEYIEYGDLSRYMKGPRTIMETKEIIRQILEGLEVLHAKGICHRDLKPQNILMASLDPIWVKIADFGVSKRTKGTYLRTLIGTQGYLAPEIIGLIPRKLKGKGFILHALDIWSLGSIAHELLTSETPFLSSDEGFESESGIQVDSSSEREIDTTLLYEYCSGTVEFPTDVLKRSQVDEEGIAFVNSLLVASPKGRPTAAHALQNPWLVGYTSGYVENLRNEFLQLGVDISPRDKKNTFMRQIDKENIIRFLPSSMESVSSLLQEAAAKGCNLVISKIFESPTSGLGSIDKLTRGELFKLAVEARKLDTIKLLLKEEADTGACIGDKTVLQWVFERGDVNSVSLLLDNTKNMGIRDSCKKLFRLAIKINHVEMIKLFLSHKVEIDGLEEAARVGRVYLVRFLLDSKTSINSGVLGGAFLVAVKGGNIDVVKLLLENKADPNGIGLGDSSTPLKLAVEGGHTEIVKLLLENNADANAIGPRPRTPLGLAIKQAFTETIMLLLRIDADVNAVGPWCDPIPLVASGENTEIIKLLLENNAPVNPRESLYTSTPLQLAAESGHTEIVKLLLENNAHANYRGSEHRSTPLELAASGGHTEIVKLLLRNNADPNSKGAGYTLRPLQQAAINGHTEIVKLLLKNNANPNIAAKIWKSPGKTVLQMEIGSGYTEIVKLLSEKNADVNAISAWFISTPLQMAIEGGYTEIFKLLLENNAEVNAIGPYSTSTPLQLAIRGGHTEMVKLLLENNANPSAVGLTNSLDPLKIAIEGGHTEIIELLRENTDAKAKSSWRGFFTWRIFK